MDNETELKLAVLPEHLEQLRRHPVLRASGKKGATAKRLVSTYYDTPSFALMRKAVALRVRKEGQTRIQTIKRGALGQSRITRPEWEKRIKGDQPDLSVLEDAELKRLIEPHAQGGELKPVFTTDVRRQTWPLRVGSSEIEFALDVGEITANGRSEPLCEVELELKSGAPSKLFELARRLNKTVPLRLEPASKAERGYNLAAGAVPKPQKASAIRLDPEMTVHIAFTAILRGCMDHIVANVDSAHAGDDPEGVHQLRVGIRRLRAAFSIFKETIPDTEREALSEELRWLQQELGAAREWDVFIEETLGDVMRHCANDGFAAVLQMAERKRAEAYERARAALGSRRYTDLLLHLEAWLEQGLASAPVQSGTQEEGSDAVGETSILDFATEVLQSRQTKAHKLGHKLRKLSDEKVHKLRIRVKKLRYAAEFFRTLYGDKAVKRYVAALKDLQDLLGTAHDAVVAGSLTSQLEESAGSAGERAVGQLQGWSAAHLRSDRRHLVGIWRKFSRLKPFWKEG